jgi:hypothetical protein
METPLLNDIQQCSFKTRTLLVTLPPFLVFV